MPMPAVVVAATPTDAVSRAASNIDEKRNLARFMYILMWLFPFYISEFLAEDTAKTAWNR
jgi:hypothetical protein